MKNIKKIIIISFFLLIISFGVQAAGYKIEIALPNAGSPAETTLPQYINYIYYIGLGAIGILALGALVIAGFRYMLSDTIDSKDEAKKMIWGALSGLVLGLAAYLILNTINPALLGNTSPTLPATQQTYQWIQIPVNKYCNDVLPGSVSVDGNYCGGTAPSTSHSCCKSQN